MVKETRWVLKFGIVLLVLGLLISGPAHAITIDFEALTELDSVTTQFSGLTFTNATVLTSGSTLNEFEFPPSSGLNVVFDDGGAMQIDFATAALTVSGRFTYSEALTLTAYDSLLSPVATVNSLFGSNLVLSGEAGSSANELLALNYAGGISRLLITGNALGGSFTLDDFTYTTGDILPPPPPPPPPPGGDVPEPTSLILVALGSVGFLAMRKK